MKELMIDYRNDKGEPVRKKMDDFEFCVRDGRMWFISEGTKINIPLEQVIQVYPT